MAGYIRQRRENSWQLTVYVGYDNKARKRRYANKTVHGNKREAQRALAKFVTEVTEGGRVATGPTSSIRFSPAGSKPARLNWPHQLPTGIGSPSSSSPTPLKGCRWRSCEPMT